VLFRSRQGLPFSSSLALPVPINKFVCARPFAAKSVYYCVD